ncbi:hypothetical protein EWH70_34985 [Amycolatopsis suaedae]|uniref:Uncharacterized protein n=1 Tax=Amycolatopsis suaedae TaxID=2510978 RepID=A0A4Q7IYH6_9PSEU|nr:hypothetical protein EWH70_34985 [Amycolatopsis suaedae]
MVSPADLRAGGMSRHDIDRRCRPGGPWRKLFPRAVLLHNSEPTRAQLVRAAVVHLGRDTIVTGVDALQAHGLGLPPPPLPHLLVPEYRRAVLPHPMLLERTTLLPRPVYVEGLPVAPVARAVVDAARRETDPGRLQELLTVPIYYGLCSADQLRAELDRGCQRGTREVRRLLRGLSSTAGTFLYAAARRLLRNLPLPPPRWNVEVEDLEGRPLGEVDAWWDEVAMGWRFGTEPAGNGSRSSMALAGADVIVVTTSPRQLTSDQDEDAYLIGTELVRAFGRAARRGRPRVRTNSRALVAA